MVQWHKLRSGCTDRRHRECDDNQTVPGTIYLPTQNGTEENRAKLQVGNYKVCTYVNLREVGKASFGVHFSFQAVRRRVGPTLPSL